MNILEDSKELTAYTAIAFLLGAFFLFYQVQYPACCDADQYAALGKLYAEKGIIANNSDASVRTYLYPLVVGYLYRASMFLSLPLTILVFFGQLLVFIYSVNKYASIIQSELPILWIVKVALFFNIFAYPFFSLTLTDSVYNTLVILWIYSVIRASNVGEKAGSWNQYLTVFGLPGLLSSVIFVVRPAGIWVVVTMVIVYAWLLFLNKSWKNRTIAISIIVACMVLPVIPQIYINMVNYGRVTPFPVFDLGAAQLQWGIENIKYATYLGGGNPQMFYLNPFYVSGQGFDWYLQNPVRVAGTVVVKLVGAFDFDYLFPYIYEHKPWYRWFTGMTSIAIFLLGAWGGLVHAFCTGRSGLKVGPRYFPLICFLTWSGVTLASAIELRFTLPMYAFLLPFTVERVSFLHRQWQSGVSVIRAWPIIAGYILLIYIANFVRMQNVFY
ncbi:MAG: hypothetical protein RBR06_08280 [Desulfuromonadaceae bacterium]|nr:hypothetical protein [Desulfuromonadaceae bacterium]